LTVHPSIDGAPSQAHPVQVVHPAASVLGLPQGVLILHFNAHVGVGLLPDDQIPGPLHPSTASASDVRIERISAKSATRKASMGDAMVGVFCTSCQVFNCNRSPAKSVSKCKCNKLGTFKAGQTKQKKF